MTSRVSTTTLPTRRLLKSGKEKGENGLEKTNEQIQAEIDELRQSPYVKLAKKAENDMLRQKLYQLRSLEKKGKKIAEALGLKI